MIEMIKEELCELIGCKPNSLSQIIKRGQLKEKINKSHYKLLGTHKEGRNIIYELEPIEITNSDKVNSKWTTLAKQYNVRKIDEFITYCKNRLLNLDKPRRYICRISNLDIDSHTRKRFDDILVDSGIIKESGMLYLKYDTKNDTYEEVTDMYYKSWLSEKRTKCITKDFYNEQKRNGTFNQLDYNIAMYNIETSYEESQGYMPVMITRYEFCGNRSG